MMIHTEMKTALLVLYWVKGNADNISTFAIDRDRMDEGNKRNKSSVLTKKSVLFI